MTRYICTSSIFVILLGALVASFVIQVPHTCWYGGDLFSGPGTSSLIVWLDVNVAMPFFALACGLAAVAGLWVLSGRICEKLRKEYK
jgi:hypothetical protein